MLFLASIFIQHETALDTHDVHGDLILDNVTLLPCHKKKKRKEEEYI
jgi:hypothetical protein